MPGCIASAAGTPATAPRRDNAEARRLAQQGQEAALAGEKVAARDAYRAAARLNPTDDRLAYDLARANEDVADTTAAIAEYCRYLTLAPEGRESADVRARLQRIVPAGQTVNAERAQSRFRGGLAMYDRRDYGAAILAFSEALERAPTAYEALFNRALARAAENDRRRALTDLEAYLVAAPVVEDRAAIVNAIALLRRPVYDPGTAFARGILPGFGQVYTGRPIVGVVALVATGGAVGLALHQQTSQRVVPYVDPNGVPVPYTETVTKRPYLAAGVGAAAAITLGAAFEASRYAARSRQGATRITASIAPGLVPTPVPLQQTRVSIAVTF